MNDMFGVHLSRYNKERNPVDRLISWNYLKYIKGKSKVFKVGRLPYKVAYDNIVDSISKHINLDNKIEDILE